MMMDRNPQPRFYWLIIYIVCMQLRKFSKPEPGAGPGKKGRNLSLAREDVVPAPAHLLLLSPLVKSIKKKKKKTTRSL